MGHCRCSCSGSGSATSDRDPILTDQAKVARRHTAVMRIWGNGLANVWADVLHNRGMSYFVPAFREYLRHT